MYKFNTKKFTRPEHSPNLQSHFFVRKLLVYYKKYIFLPKNTRLFALCSGKNENTLSEMSCLFLILSKLRPKSKNIVRIFLSENLMSEI